MAAGQLAPGRPAEGVVARDGFGLHYRVFGAGRPLLVLAGGPGIDCDYVEPLARKLAGLSMAILPELRGTGRSRPAAVGPETVNVRLCIDDLEALRESLALKRWIIAGHSAGGLLALRYALAHPGRVQALVLVNPAPARGALASSVFDTVLMGLPAEAAAEAQRTSSFRTMLPGYFYGAAAARAMQAEFRDAWVRGDAMQALNGELFAPDGDLRPALAELATPALIVGGRQDPADPGMQLDLSMALRNAELLILERCGHFAWLERPEVLLDAVRRFLDEHDK